MTAPRHPPAILALALALALAAGALPLLGPARAQTLDIGVTGSIAGGSGGPASPGGAATGGRVSLGIQGASVGGDRVDLGLAYDAAGRGTGQLDFGVQANDTFGPLGNVVADARVALRTDAQAQGDLAAQGVLGPLAVGARLSAFTADPSRFDPMAVASDTRPDFGAGGLGISLHATGRPSRSLVLEAAPQAYVVPAGVAARATARVRFLRALGRNELSIRGLGYLTPGARAFDGAVGVGLTIDRRRAPKLDGAVYLGWSQHGLRPGATASLGQQLGPVLAMLELEAEPYRLDVPPYRAQLTLDFPLGSGKARLEGAAAAGPGERSGVLGVRYQLPVTLPR